MSAALDLALTTELDEDNPVIGDLRIDGTEFALVEDLDAIAQEVGVRLRWWLGEWFLDTRRGTPYIQQLLVKGVSDATVREVLSAQIRAVDGIARVDSLTVERGGKNRLASITFSARTSTGGSIAASVPFAEVR